MSKLLTEKQVRVLSLFSLKPDIMGPISDIPLTCCFFRIFICDADVMIAILLQAHISQKHVNNFALVSDSAYVMQSAGRIARALFEIVLKKGWTAMAEQLLTLAKVLEF